jgi:hypothetical protein
VYILFNAYAATSPVFLVITGLVTVAVVSVANCLQPEDAVAIDVIKERIGFSIPLVRRFVPEDSD